MNFFFFLFIIPLFGQAGLGEDKLFKHMTGFPLIKSVLSISVILE